MSVACGCYGSLNFMDGGIKLSTILVVPSPLYFYSTTVHHISKANVFILLSYVSNTEYL